MARNFSPDPEKSGRIIQHQAKARPVDSINVHQRLAITLPGFLELWPSAFDGRIKKGGTFGILGVVRLQTAMKELSVTIIVTTCRLFYNYWSYLSVSTSPSTFYLWSNVWSGTGIVKGRGKRRLAYV